MDLSVNNMPSLSHTLFGINQNIESSQIRLSTGLRINSAKDDPTGLAQANLVSSEISENDVIISDIAKTKAINDYYSEGISSLKGQMEDIMILVDQAKDSSITADDRTAIQNDINDRITAYNNTVDSFTFSGTDLVGASAVTLSVSKNGTAIASNSTETNTNLRLGAIDVSSAGNASTAYTTLEGAQESTLKTEYLQAGTAGASMEIEVERLSKVNAILETTKSQIQDADIAEETAKLTRNQILNQSTTAVMGQANTITSTALSLMNGIFS